jgi:hypothetical protein
MKKSKKVIVILVTVAIIIAVLYFLQKLLVPKYVDGIVEGALVAEYYQEENKDFDVIFIGDCEVYENFSPVALWEEYGINSYIRGSAEQYIFQSYYLLEDTLRYHKPEVVVFNIQSLQFGKAQNEAYNRMSIEGMKWSKSKVDCIKASMTEEEDFITYLFPILRYHSRWNEITSEDFKYMFKSKKISHNGYFMRIDVKAAENVPTGRPLGSYDFDENAWKYLDMMRELCEENDIKLIMIKAPSLYPYWYDQYDAQVVDYAKKYNLPYYNFLSLGDETGIDYSTDTYDGGLHMNLSGAEKLSHYFGNILVNEYGVSDRRGDAALEAIWNEKIKDYNAEIEAQKIKYGID